MGGPRVVVTRKVSRGGRLVSVKRVDAFAPVLAGLKPAILEATATQLRVVAEETRELIVDKLFAGKAQPPGFAVAKRPPPLRPSKYQSLERAAYRFKKLQERYARRKAKLRLDGRILIATADYVGHIDVVRGERSGAGVYYTVRPSPGVHKPSKLTYTTIARIHEYGTATIPARPHWRPVVTAVHRRAAEIARKLKSDTLRTLVRGVA